MIVIFNSDILFSQKLARGKLPNHLADFMAACASIGVRVLVPETASHEFKHYQEKLALEERNRLRAAIDRVKHWNIEIENVELDSVISTSDLSELISQSKVENGVLYPTLEDFQHANFRACMHAPPSLPESKSDEMRDLVIWMAAIRTARENGGAILLSRDEVHTNPRGDEEAEGVGLKRFKSVDDALAFIAAEGVAGKSIREILSTSWTKFHERGFPVSEMPSAISILESTFIRGNGNLGDTVNARIQLKIPPKLNCEFRIRATPLSSEQWQVNVWDFVDRKQEVDCEPFAVQIEMPATESEAEFDDRLQALRRTIGG